MEDCRHEHSRPNLRRRKMKTVRNDICQPSRAETPKTAYELISPIEADSHASCQIESDRIYGEKL